jgi:hypothetical protein
MPYPKKQIIFGGCGGMYNYLLGVASVLQHKMDLRDCVFCGVSAGCFPAMLLALGEPIDTINEKWNIPFLREVNNHTFGAFGVWNSIVRKYTMEHLPQDAYKQLSGKLYISITRLHPYMKLKNEIISHYDSNKMLVNALIASSFVPFFDTKLTHNYNGGCYLDGSLTNGNPIPFPNVPTMKFTIDKWRPIKLSWLWCWSDENWTRQLYKLGKHDANNHHKKN